MHANDGRDEIEAPRGYLLSGEAISHIMPEQIRQKLGELGIGPDLVITPVRSVAELLSLAGSRARQDRLEPIAVTRQVFRTFAAKQGYSQRCADLAWCSVRYAQYDAWASDPFPLVRRVESQQKGEEDAVDLQSIAKRVTVGERSPQAWSRAGPRVLSFIGDLVDHHAALGLIQDQESLP